MSPRSAATSEAVPSEVDRAASRTAARELADALSAVVDRMGSDAQPLTVLFSGGLDSSLVAHLVRDRPSIQLWSVGRVHAADLEAARTAAHALGLPWSARSLEDSDLAAAWQGWASPLRSLAEPSRSVLFALGLSFASAPGRELWIGQGADELFGGYAHFEGLSPEAAERRSLEDLQRLRGIEWPRTVELAARWSVTLRAPYLEESFVRAVHAVPPEVRFLGVERKPLLRAVARALGLPEEIARRPKRAMQYGTGVQRWVRSQGP